MAYIPMIQCPDGECQVWHRSPITNNLEKDYYRLTCKFPLMDRIDDKYWMGSLNLLLTFSPKVRSKHQEEIETILDGFSEGDIW
jgi:hypothetical protein